jgi:hypothetical protein
VCEALPLHKIQSVNASDAQVQLSVGRPLLEMTLQSVNGLVFLRENRPLFRVLEFAEEFGNSLREKPAARA